LIHKIVITATARLMLDKISDLRVREKVRDAIDALASEPELRGKPLVGDLKGYRSVRAVGQRYRIIYRVERSTVTVAVVAAGIRKEGSREDIYTLAQRLVKLGLL
jgi:mRNA interferase RelE/StbE